MKIFKKKRKCSYCRGKNKGFIEIYGKNFELKKTAGYTKENMIHSSWIMKGEYDKKAGIMFDTYNTEGVFIDINYCPMCGRKLV